MTKIAKSSEHTFSAAIELPPPLSWHRHQERSPSPVSWLREQHHSPRMRSTGYETHVDLTTPSPENLIALCEMPIQCYSYSLVKGLLQKAYIQGLLLFLKCTQDADNTGGNTGCDVQDTEEALIQAALELSVNQSSTGEPTPE